MWRLAEYTIYCVVDTVTAGVVGTVADASAGAVAVAAGSRNTPSYKWNPPASQKDVRV